MADTIRGLKEIQRDLKSLPDNMQQNVLRSGNRALANEVGKEIQTRADLPTTVTAGVTAQADPAKPVTKGFLVGLRTPFSSMGHWFEYGTGPRWNKAGAYRGQMPATPWLRPPLETVGAKAEQIWSKGASKNLDRQLRKIGK